ncbi:hypothetical protein LTR94_027876, partial [Friedmanniomyces endolithicus]
FLGGPSDLEMLEAVSQIVGADGPMCLRAETAWAEGRGEALTPETRLPALPAVLFNPMTPSPTGAVYRAYDAGPVQTAERPADPKDWSVGAVIDWLADQRNDLEAPAIGLEPAIGVALDQMRSAPCVKHARMSGSGAPIFGLFHTMAAAEAAAAWLCEASPQAWVKSAWLGRQ